MKRALREHMKELIAILALVAAAFLSVVVILTGQQTHLPSWVPFFGSNRFELKAEFSSAQAVTPGQGQAVDIAGIEVGDVTAVDLVNGDAVVTMQIDNKYAPLVHDDASLLLRPKTGLNDMVLELTPGQQEGTAVKEGATIPLASTQPNVNPDEFLATLDADTRAFLKLLLAGGAEGLGGKHGLALSATLRRLEPTSRDLARINGALAKRRVNVARSIHNFRLLTDELASKDQTLASFVDTSNAVLSRFAAEESSLRAAFRELPGTLRQTHGALDSTNQFGIVAEPALRKLLPSARGLAPALRAIQPFFRQTVGPIRTQIRPFARQIQTPVFHLRQLATPLGNTTPPLNHAFQSLNHLLNALAFNPSGSQEGYLFWLPWLNHNTNTLFRAQDSQGPLRRGMVMITCGTTSLAQGLIAGRPFLKTLFEINQLPGPSTAC